MGVYEGAALVLIFMLGIWIGVRLGYSAGVRVAESGLQKLYNSMTWEQRQSFRIAISDIASRQNAGNRGGKNADL